MSQERPQTFAIVPAAGASRRMGVHKLLLPLEGRPVIEHVLSAWRASRVDHVVLVLRPGDDEVRAIGQRLGADLLEPAAAPPEMKDSVQLALAHIAETCHPGEADAWLLAPADMPRLDAGVIDSLLAANRADRPATLVPVSDGRRGHPVLFPWGRAAEVHALPPGQGINALLQSGPIIEVPVEEPGIHVDLDTPEDYRRLGVRLD